MKHKYLFFSLVSIPLLCGVSSCKQNNVDVFATSEKLAMKTMLGTDSVVSGTHADGFTLQLDQYNFLSSDKVLYTNAIWGNGKAQNFEMMYNYTVDGFNANGAGLKLTLTPVSGGETKILNYISDGLLDSEDWFVGDKINYIPVLASVAENLPGTSWKYIDSTIWFDTLQIIDTIITKRWTKVEGKDVLVRDTTYKKVEKIDTLGVKEHTYRTYAFTREAVTLQNAGRYQYRYRAWNKDLTPKTDSVVAYTFHWGLSSITAAKKFSVYLKADEGEQVADEQTLNFMKFTKGKTTNINSLPYVALDN